ncbi:MAG TPA: hypothetical protein VHM90_08815 [Phycisphaerae bacterium]|jgi:hypothetical protein|nr:hypothetical protein [Phycisphaerae bacterium]
MNRILAIVAMSIACSACTYDPVTGDMYGPHWGKPDIGIADSDHTSTEYQMAEQRYAREHEGRLPPSGTKIYP